MLINIGLSFLFAIFPSWNVARGGDDQARWSQDARVVFAPTNHEVPLNDHYQWWSYVKGANWRHPLGPESDIKGKERYPVVQIAYPDAEAYAKWAGKRLPTEAEFEFAARGGLSGKTYTCGDDFHPNGKWMANTWQGKFPVKDTGEDGYAGIAPVEIGRASCRERVSYHV